MVKNPLANAGDTGSIPGLGGSHTPWGTEAMHSITEYTQQLPKPAHHSPHATLERPHSPQLEDSPRATTGTYCSQKQVKNR